MSLLEKFMNENKEVYQVTKNEWVEIMRDHHLNSCNRTQEEFENHTKQEVECYHLEQVRNALKQEISITEAVMLDYPGLIEKTQARKQEEQNKPKITLEQIQNLKINDKIMIDHYKFTVHSITDNKVVARLYKSKRKAIEITEGMYGKLSLGWNL